MTKPKITAKKKLNTSPKITTATTHKKLKSSSKTSGEKTPNLLDFKHAVQAIVMLPTYNEKDNISKIIPAILAQDPYLNICVVDDNSPDGTGRIADELAEKYKGRIHVLHRTKKGRGSAGIDGFKYCLKQDVDCIIEMDADFSHDPRDIPRMLKLITQFDVIIGSRNAPGGKQVKCTPFHRFISFSANLFNSIVLCLNVKDNTGGFKCYRKSILRKINLDYIFSTEYSIGAELLFRLKQRNATMKEIPITFRNRVYGNSKGTWNVIINYPLTILKLKFISFVDAVREHVHYGRYNHVYRCIKEAKKYSAVTGATEQESKEIKLLDIGCGRPCDSMEDGSFVKFISRRGFKAQGLDIRNDMTIDFPFTQGDIYKMPFKDNQFDVIVAMEVFEHIDHPLPAVNEVKRCLKKDGIFVISTPTDSLFQRTFWWFWERTFGGQWHETHVHVMTPKKWLNILKQHFTLKKYIHYWRGMAFIAKMKNDKK